jgi:MFS family permease
VHTPAPARVLAGTAAITTACVFPAFLMGAMAVQVRDDLGFSETGTGLGVAAFFAAAALSSLALGRVTERRGARWGLRSSGGVSAGASLAVAGLARSLPVLCVLLAVAGAANALCQPAANLLIARHLPVHRQGLAFAIKQAAIPLATLLAGLAVPVIALSVGWRWAFVAAAILALGSALLAPDVDPAERTSARSREARPEARSDTRGAVMAVLAVGIGFGAAAAGTLGAFLVSAAVEAGMSEGGAGLLLTGGSLLGITVRVLAGVRADRRDGGHLRVVAAMLAAGAVAYALLATMRLGVFIVAAPLAFATGWAWPGLFNLAVVRANPSSPAAATGLTQTGTYLGAVSGPLLFGLVAEAVSYRAAWLLAGGFAVLAALAMIAGRNALRRDRVARLDPSSLAPIDG